jgi:hypothetical protein
MTPEKQAKLEFVQQRILQLRQYLLTSEPVVSLNVGGQSIVFDRKGAIDELRELEREEQDLLRPNRRVQRIDLRKAF